jgi:hypothetical protein
MHYAVEQQSGTCGGWFLLGSVWALIFASALTVNPTVPFAAKTCGQTLIGSICAGSRKKRWRDESGRAQGIG